MYSAVFFSFSNLWTLNSGDMLADSPLENNTMLFQLANSICRLHLLLFLIENNFWLLCIDEKNTHNVKVA
jgi:hypothetical protein